jgi:acetoin utilization protein AcuB
MTRDVVWVDPEFSLHDAAEIMKEWEIRHLPVMEAGKLVGILSDRDVLLRTTLADDGATSVASLPVRLAMTPDPIFCMPTSSIAHVALTMVGKKIDSLPVVDDDGGLIGLITSSDLMDLLAAQERGEATLADWSSLHFNVVGADAQQPPQA